jgi:sodium-independent sulfate anion transporter 11
LSTGFLIDFISGPVASGFTSAAALIIVTSQVKDILGIKATGATFIEYWQNLADDMHNAKLWDPILGVICIIILLLMKVQINFTDFIHMGWEAQPNEPSHSGTQAT